MSSLTATTSSLILRIANMDILRGFLAVLRQLFLKNIFSQTVKCLLYVDICFGTRFQETDAMFSGNLGRKKFK